MFTLLLVAALNAEPVIYIAIDDEPQSKMLYSELHRDWTKSPHINDNGLAKAKEVNADIAEFKSFIKIVVEKPHFVREYPSFRFSKYEGWIPINKKAFVDTTRPYQTILHHGYKYYQEDINRIILKRYYEELKRCSKIREEERKHFVENNKFYTRTIPEYMDHGTGHVYNMRTRKYEMINDNWHIHTRDRTELYKKYGPTPTYYHKMRKLYKKWSEEFKELKIEFCRLNPDYTITIPVEHNFGYGEVFNLITRKFENIEHSVEIPKLMYLYVPELPYKENKNDLD